LSFEDGTVTKLSYSGFYWTLDLEQNAELRILLRCSPTPFSNIDQLQLPNRTFQTPSYHAIGEFLAWSQRCGFLVWKTSKCIPCRAQTTGYATAQSGALFLGRRGCEILLPLSFRWQPNIATTQSQRRHPTMGEHFPTPPSPSLCNSPNRAADLFPLFCSWLSFH
jgi:hypothetical protein